MILTFSQSIKGSRHADKALHKTFGPTAPSRLGQTVNPCAERTALVCKRALAARNSSQGYIIPYINTKLDTPLYKERPSAERMTPRSWFEIIMRILCLHGMGTSSQVSYQSSSLYLGGTIEGISAKATHQIFQMQTG